MTITFIDTFASRISEMSGRDKGDPMKVLAVIEQNPVVSIFEATESVPIAKSMDYLVQKKFIQRTNPDMQYPWMRYELTKRGKSRMKQLRRKARSK